MQTALQTNVFSAVMVCSAMGVWAVLYKVSLAGIVYTLSVTGTGGTSHPVIFPAVKIIEEFHAGEIISSSNQNKNPMQFVIQSFSLCM